MAAFRNYGSTGGRKPLRYRLFAATCARSGRHQRGRTSDVITGKRIWAHGPKGDVEPNAPAVLYWFELNREGRKVRFIPHLIDNDSGVGTQVMAVDVNKDGKVDIVAGNKKGLFVHLQK